MLTPPIKKGTITSAYGYRRSPFNSAITQFHSGVDIAPTTDYLVYVAYDGIVRRVDGDNPTGTSGFGNVVYVETKDGNFNVYGHLKSIQDAIVVGHKVKQGDIIGVAGSTGKSTGTHLHFEIRKQIGVGDTIDPKITSNVLATASAKSYNIIKRNPVTTIAIGVLGTGIILALIFRKKIISNLNF
jgi:murein DD-endopeptidase MepM/ murein hydrolase activator NlpD